MFIMTAQGWAELKPQVIVPATPPTPYNGVPAPYTGTFPSQDLCRAFNEIKDMLLFFDDGLRMVYGKVNKMVETNNRVAEHPIQYPPKGF